MRLAKLVRRETCAEVAAEWDVGPHVAMGQGEARAGGRKKEAILADICEAIIGAAYLDAGFAMAHEVVARSWRPRMDADVSPERDAKTAVQEWAQARALSAPRYVELARSGPAHRPISSCRWCSKATSRKAARRPPSAPPNKPPRRRSSRGGAAHERDPLRLRRAGRRAERWQIDAAQCADRRESVDRFAQGADDARHRARHPGRRRDADDFVERLACSRRSGGSTGRWSPRPGARRRGRRVGAADRRKTGNAADERAASETGEATQAIMTTLRNHRAPKFLVLNKVDLVDRPMLLALAERLNAALPFAETFMTRPPATGSTG